MNDQEKDTEAHSFLVVCPDSWGEDPRFAPTNVHGPCSRCGQPCHWRHHAPTELRRICITCSSHLVTPAHIPTVSLETMLELSNKKEDN